MRTSVLKASLIAVILMVALCLSLPVANADGEVVPTLWTSPTTNTLISVFMVNANDGWAVGFGGTIIRWNGIQWNNVTSLGGEPLQSVYMVSSNDGWAVGGGSRTGAHWNGSQWTVVTGPTDLRSVYMVSSNDGWAVGWGIIHWNGTQWNAVTSPTTKVLNSVFMVSANDGWAVGSTGTIIHWNGTDWATVTSPTASEFLSVYMVSANDGWAVGYTSPTYIGTIIHWDGTSWSNVTSPTTQLLSSVFMVSATDGWAVCGGTLIRWNGTQWSTVATPTTSLTNVFMVSASDGWAVGFGGTIIRLTGPQVFPVVWDGTTYPVVLSSNSSITEFSFNQPNKLLSFNVSGPDATSGFCNITIPKELLNATPADWTVLVDDVQVSPTVTWNATHTFIYFTYTHSNHSVKIIGTQVVPEFPTPLILPLLMLLSMLTAILAKRRLPRKHKT